MKKLTVFLAALFILTVCYAEEKNNNVVKFQKNPGVEISDPKNSDIPLGFPRYFSKKLGRWNKEYARSGDAGLRINLKEDSGPAIKDIAWKNLALDPGKLYRFSFWYKTIEKELQPGTLRIDCNKCYKYYSSSKTWQRAIINFKGLKKNNVTILGIATKNGVLRRDKDNKNKFLNRVDLSIDLDDFGFRELTDDDYQGNLIEDADFENDNEYPVSWKQTFSCDKRLVTIESQTAGKNKVLRVQVPEGDKARAMAVYSNFMPMKAGNIYEIAFDVRTDKSGYKTLLRLSEGNKRIPVFFEKTITPKLQWKRYEFFMETPKDGDYKYLGEKFLARLSFWIWGNKKQENDSSLYLDKVKVKLVDVQSYIQ